MGSTYRIFDDQTGLAPSGLIVRRADNDLVVSGLRSPDSSEEVSVELPEYYSLCSASSACQLTIETGTNARVEITAASQPIGALSDGSFVLYDPSFVPSTLSGAGESIPVRPILYGLGGLAVVGLAAGGGGGDGDAPPAGVGPTSELKVTSAPFVNSRTPLITGEGEPGARILVQLDANGDGTTDVGYATIVGADFRWTINLATDAPVQGSLPVQGLPDTSAVRVGQSIAGGEFQILPLYTLTFDDTAPARATINPIAGDNIVTGPEKTAGVNVSGTAEANGSVLVTWGLASKIVPVDAAGQWQAGFSRTEIPADALTPGMVTAIARDVAGNSAVAAQAAVTVNTGSFPLSIGISRRRRHRQRRRGGRHHDRGHLRGQLDGQRRLARRRQACGGRRRRQLGGQFHRGRGAGIQRPGRHALYGHSQRGESNR